MSTITNELTDRYEVLEALTGSALFAIYRVRERATGASYVLTMPRPHIIQDAAIVDRFREAMGRLQGVQHPALARVREVGGRGGTDVWVVSESIAAPTLRSLLIDGLPLEDALDAIAQVADGVDAAHRAGVLHGDIHARRVHLADDGRARLTGTALAALADAVQPFMRTALQTPLPAALAPELLRGGLPSVQSDVYALGLVLYEVVTGHLPFPGNTPEVVRVRQDETSIPPPSRLNSLLPPALDGLIATALAWEPRDRHRSAALFAEAVRGVRASLTERQASTVVPPERAREEIRSHQGSRHGAATIASRTATADESDRNLFRVCPICLTANTADAVHCRECWRDIASIPALTEEEGRALSAGVQRRARQRRMVRFGLLAAAALAVIALFLYDRTAPPGLLTGAPTTALTSAQGEGLWTTPRNGASGPGSVLNAAHVPTGTVRWERNLGGEIASSPVVAAGRVFITTLDRRILALDAATGRTLWETPVSGPMEASPVVAGDRLFVALRESRVLSLDAASGEVLWSSRVANPVFSWVAVDQGILYALSLDGTMQTLDAGTGEVRWRIPTGLSFLAPPAISDGRLVAPSMGRRVFVLNGRTGHTNLVYVTRHAVETSPAIADGVAVLGGNDLTVRAIDIHDSNLPLEKTVLKWWTQFYIWQIAPFPPAQSGTLWAQTVGESVTASPAIASDRTVAVTTAGTLIAFDLDDGTELWRTALDEAGATKTGAPTVVNDVVFIGTDRGNLNAVDLATGEARWTMPLAGPVLSSPAFAGGSLYVTTRAGHVYAID